VLTVRAGNLTNAPLAVGVQIGRRQEKSTVEIGRSKGVGVATGLGDGEVASGLGDGLALAADALGRSDGLGGAAAWGVLLQAASITAASRNVALLT
jgi:hypothetical protein